MGVDLAVYFAPYGMTRRAVLVFVKAPEPGRVKTRLAKTVGPEQAAAIYRRLAEAVFARLPADVEVLVVFDPPERRAEVERWLGGSARRFFPQAFGNLGSRLERALDEAFALGFAQVAAIGTDCVDLNAPLFEQAWAALDTNNVVLGPSEDGGYYLIALRKPCAALFTDIDWSTERVFEQTVARAATANLRVHLLPKFHDVDTEEDWRRAEPRLNS